MVKMISSNRKKIIVLGTEMANATKMEQKRLRESNFGESPMPKENYENWPDENHLYNPIFNSLDSALQILSIKYEKNGPEDRAKMRIAISLDEIYTLLIFSKRASIFAQRKKDIGLLKSAINSISMIEADRCDFRDILISLSLIYYAADKLNINSNDFFKRAANISDAKTAKLIIDFTKRSQINRDIKKSWGFFPFETTNGIGFLSYYFKKYFPKRPIHEIMLKMSKILVSDKYTSGSISVGTEIAEVWLSSNNKDEFSDIFKKMNGCASLSSTLKDKNIKNHTMLLIYVAEFEDKSIVDTLYEILLNRKKNSFSRLILKLNNLFCIMIERSIVVGFNSIETDESLKRFEIPIKELMEK